MALDALPALWSRPSLAPQVREPVPTYPLQSISTAAIEKEKQNLEITRKAFFTLASYTRYLDCALGATAWLSVAYVSLHGIVGAFNSKYPSAAITLRPLNWSLRICPPALALHFYCRFSSVSEKYFQAGVTYNCLYRRTRAVQSITDDEQRHKAWQDLQRLRDDWESHYSTWVPDWFHTIIKRQVQAEKK